MRRTRALALLLAAASSPALAQVDPAEGLLGKPTPVEPPSFEYEHDKGADVHDVRGDIGRSTQDKLDEIRKLHHRLRNPDPDVMNPETVRRRFDELYRELDRERRATSRAGIYETNPAAKREYGRQARLIADTLVAVRPRRAGMSLDQEYQKAMRDKEEDEAKIARREASYAAMKRNKILQMQKDADKVINGSDGDAAHAMLARLKQDYNEKRANSLEYSAIQLADYRTYIVDYERSLHRKWPTTPKQAGPARSASVMPETRDPMGPPPGAIDPMRRHGLNDPLAPKVTPARAMPSAWDADVMRNRIYREQDRANEPAKGKESTGPGSQQEPTPPPIGELPTVKGGPQSQGAVDYPTNN